MSERPEAKVKAAWTRRPSQYRMGKVYGCLAGRDDSFKMIMGVRSSSFVLSYEEVDFAIQRRWKRRRPGIRPSCEKELRTVRFIDLAGDRSG